MAPNIPELIAGQGRVDVQRTTFSYDVVARFICNTLDEVEAQQRTGGRPFDVVVIGSGMYGAYAASKLFDLGRTQRARTLVLEAGPFLLTEHIQNLARLGYDVQGGVLERHWVSNMDERPPEDRYSPHHVCVGGKSAFWGGWSAKFKDDDLVRWPAEVTEFLRAHYPVLEEETGVVPDTDFIRGTLNDALEARMAAVVGGVTNLVGHDKPPIAVQGNSPGPGLFSFDKYSSLPVLIDAIRDGVGEAKGADTERRLFLVPRTRVIRMETDRGVVKSITVWSDGQVRAIDVSPTTVVLLAAQSINSTRIALESFPTTGVRATERMGRNMMAHLRGNFTVRIKREAFGLKPAAETGPLQVGARQVDGRTADGRFHFQVYAATNFGSNAEEFLYRMIPNLDDLDRILASQDNEWVNVTVRTVAEMEDSRNLPIGDTGRSWIDLSPNSRDVFGSTSVPSAFVNLVTTANDERLWAATEKAAFDFVLALAGGKPENIEYLLRDNTWTSQRPATLSDFRDGLGTTFHECGTLWLGDDPATSVTDVSGRFHHVANAGCTDQALFPTSGSANPALTGLTLTRKVVRDLLSRLDTSDVPVPDNDTGFTQLFTGVLEPDWEKADAPNFSVFPGPGGKSFIEAGLPGADSLLGVLWYTKQEFSDFILRLEWKTFSIDANAGVFIRAPRPQPPLFGSGFYDAATEIQIDERGKDFQAGRNPQALYGRSLHKTGAIYEVAPATRWAARVPRPRFGGREGGWNLFEITARGRSVEVRLNGYLVSQTKQLPAVKLDKGFIGLQCHTDLAQFRNIRVKSL